MSLTRVCIVLLQSSTLSDVETDVQGLHDESKYQTFFQCIFFKSHVMDLSKDLRNTRLTRY